MSRASQTNRVTAPGRSHRTRWALFLTLFAAFAYFHQGGGWHQNVRFDQVRSIVEAGELSINHYLAYRLAPGPDGQSRVRRVPLPVPFVFGAELPPVNTWDVAFHDGRFYPNKPPGGTLLAVPAYWLTYHAERALRADPDGAWTLTWNAYLASMLSVGLLGALGGVVFHGLSRRLFPAVARSHHAAAALSLGMATLWLPYSTILFDQVPTAVFLLLGFGSLVGAKEDSGDGRPARWWRLAAGGGCCGLAVLSNYSALPAVAILCLYALQACRPRWRAGFFVAGGVLPAVVLLTYQKACFGGAFTLANTYQPKLFLEESGHWLSVLGVPDWVVLVKLLFSTYRGLFLSSPVLLLGGYGLARMWAGGHGRAEAAVCALVFAAFLLFNASFNGWDGGWCFGPRYLVPAVPFLTLPLALAYERYPRLTGLAAVASALIMFLATAVTVMVPQGFPHPFANFILPLAAGGTIDTPVFSYTGPVSVNPSAVHACPVLEEWSSFNLGEFLWPRRWVSVLPLMLLLGGGVAGILGLAREGRESCEPLGPLR